MKKLLPFLLAVVLLTTVNSLLSAQSFTLTGKVINSVTGKPLVGANILIEGTTRGTASNKDGNFQLNASSKETITLRVSYIGYFAETKTISSADRNIDTISLRPRTIESSEVVVTATRAVERETPVAFSNMNRQDIEDRYDLQDVPMLLNDQTSVYSYSETGASIGYTYMRLRGFDQSRIAVMLNGIPLNDPESHAVYWVDLSDFGENIKDLQIQRGVGNSLYGASAIGGSVNVITHNFSNERNINFSTSAGSYNTRKATLGLSSGLIDNKYAVYGRFSRLLSDGYRDQAWSDLWSYFFSAVRFDDKVTNQINIFGGPEKTHLTYEGLTRQQIQTDRKQNPLYDPNDIDNTFQPHYQLLTEWNINENLFFTNSLYFIEAKGYYRNIKSRRDLFEYDLTPFSTSDPSPYLSFADFRSPDENGMYEIKNTDLVRRRWVDNKQFGLIPRLEIQHNNGTLTIGSEIRLHRAKHWGEVLWVPVPFPNIDHNHRYYDYKVDKNSVTSFLHENYQFSGKLSIMADLQYSHHKYDFYADQRNDIEFDINYNFVSPRFGANYNIDDHMNIFGNFSISQREPTFRSIYDAQYAYSTPNFSGSSLDDPAIKPEKMYNYEAGFGYSAEKFSAKINLYYMDFRNEMIRWGGAVDEEGIAVAGNAKKSYHRGIELTAAYKFIEELRFDGNISLSQNKLVKHTEYDNDWSVWPPGIIEKNFDGNVIGGFPSTITNLSAQYNKNGFFGRIHFQHIGNQYLDNSENEKKNPEVRNTAGYINKTIDAYSLVNMKLVYKLKSVKDFKSIEFSLSLYNLLASKYEATGYIDGGPLWIPGATRNILMGLRFDM